MQKRLLIVAKDFNQAKHWARMNRIAPAGWVFVACVYNVIGNPDSEYVLLPDWQQRPGTKEIMEELIKQGCVER